MTGSQASTAPPFRPPPPRAVTIAGPAGAIEARLEDPIGPGKAVRRIGVVCHPHPLFDGTMQNKVVHTTARAMQEAGAPTVRFNFRGVGQSAGAHDAGLGEVDDAVAVVKWLRERFQCDDLWLAGFSFGAAVALQAASRVSPRRLVTIAPPVGRIITSPIPRAACPWRVVHGGRDELVAVDAVRQWVETYDPPPELIVVADAVHFFHGKLLELRAAVLEFLRQDAGDS
jgi:alpha/beta superfamily hydrolase